MVETYLAVRIIMMLTAVGITSAIIGAGKLIAARLRTDSKRIAVKPLSPAHTH